MRAEQDVGGALVGAVAWLPVSLALGLLILGAALLVPGWAWELALRVVGPVVALAAGIWVTVAGLRGAAGGWR